MHSKVTAHNDPPSKQTAEKDSLKNDIFRHIRSMIGRDPGKPNKYAIYMGLAYSVRDRLIEKWITTQRLFYDTLAKRIYFLSLEFLPGRFLKTYLISLGMEKDARKALSELGVDLDELEEEEWDPGLGNGGLGRLASCYMDSLACTQIPAYGYGIQYDYGIFHQIIEDGYQREYCDNWKRRGTPWCIERLEYLQQVQFYGRSETYADEKGNLRYRWVDGEIVMALACDILIPSYKDDYVTNMRLWSARSSREFDLIDFNQGDYIGAVESKVLSENISKVLYPSDDVEQGRELRLKQQYFFVAATLADIFRRFGKMDMDISNLPELVAIQLNDTHPSIAVAEFMRILLDEKGIDWDSAYNICQKTFAYTNHTTLPEALEAWPVDLIERLLPRHMQIIYEINHRFLNQIRRQFPHEPELVRRLSLIEEGPVKKVRMAHLAIVVSHSVNGVANLHSRILKERLFCDFNRVFPQKIKNVTNGITPRRWLLQVNPALSGLISNAIGEGWIQDLEQLRQLVPLAEDSQFQTDWMTAKLENKKRLARYILRKIQAGVDPTTLFDVQVKRMHEYKRQLLNLLHVITLYFRIRENPDKHIVARTVLFAGKAAPAYYQAKLIIKLINSVAQRVNNDSSVQGKLRVYFLPNYCVSQAEKIIPAADLSEQISTAGMEASGTGNMKMSLNGSLTIGTLDGANVEIMEAVGKENFFLFGLTAEEIVKKRRNGYDPEDYYWHQPELRKAIDMIATGFFSPKDPRLFAPIVQSLFETGDFYMLLADYAPYIAAQEAVAKLFADSNEWARRSILNTANMGRFSSDRSVKEYAERIWGARPVNRTG
jgi:starch phosphorylase